ncbi:hypothetical protein [Corynebacterium minutissimum]|uniref:Uncharacterized protein n=1 Tax=Corynebacterium minutissimum TaxID=38301 RepID=A0A2X4RN08_9CORY|nr:hypothetical protein [Corynebacterium minutissimum]KHO29801.1 hypothetical protein NX84_05540 [Corynebacterium minutissimum]QPS58579.1 hypothetical protein I6G51_06355 [Corynebacterium minutissimum]QQA78429.1 hypothetical protein I6H49_06500 [Corynebacterium minutissimum]SQI00318.1 Uncharacterised protein [Corynebacterium minutissimum]VEG05615.1 Uncharacterised protein [Corynebacterium minutissimum]
MKRIGGLVLVTACVGVLSSCVSLQGLSVRSHGDGTGGSHNFSDVRDGGGSVDSGVADATAMGERESEAADGVLPPLGNFDKASPDFDLFDPCSEIPASYLHAFGFRERMPSRIRETGISHCGFQFETESGGKSFVGLGVTDRTIGDIENRQEFGRIYEGNEIAAIAFGDPTYGKLFCTLYLETRGGTIILNASGGASVSREVQRCEFGEMILVRLIKGR